MESQYTRAKRILSENKDKLTALAMQLLEKEVIFKEDLEKIFGDRPFQKPEQPTANGLSNGSGTSGATKPEEAPTAGKAS